MQSIDKRHNTGYNLAYSREGVVAMIVKTRVFDLSCKGFKNLSELAKAMGISVSQVYRVREGKRGINQKFIIGAVKAFPEHKLDDLFYFAPDEPTASGFNKK